MDDQEDLKLPGVGSLPISYIESEHRLLDKLGSHAVVLLLAPFPRLVVLCTKAWDFLRKA
jgi:hypothetical protein